MNNTDWPPIDEEYPKYSWGTVCLAALFYATLAVVITA